MYPRLLCEAKARKYTIDSMTIAMIKKLSSCTITIKMQGQENKNKRMVNVENVHENERVVHD